MLVDPEYVGPNNKGKCTFLRLYFLSNSIGIAMKHWLDLIKTALLVKDFFLAYVQEDCPFIFHVYRVRKTCAENSFLFKVVCSRNQFFEGHHVNEMVYNRLSCRRTIFYSRVFQLDDPALSYESG